MITILDQWDLYENDISEKELRILQEKINKKLQECKDKNNVVYIHNPTREQLKKFGEELRKLTNENDK
jgi:hypothetical protein